MKLSVNSKFTISQLLILGCFFLSNMNVANLYAYFFFAAFAVVIIANIRRLVIDHWFIVLMLFSTSYLIFCPNVTTSMTTVLKQFNYPMCYLLGLNFISPTSGFTEEQKEYQRKAAFVLPALGAFAHYLLNMVTNFDSLLRNTVDIWTGEIMPATGQVCLAILAVGVFTAWLFSETPKWLKVLSGIGLFLALLYNFILAGRTLLLLLVLVLAVAFVYSIATSHFNRKGTIIAVTLLVAGLVLAAYLQNWFGLREWILGSNLSARFDVMNFGDDTRMENKRQYFALMLEYPLGGTDLRKAVGGYAHELYLDVYSDAGFIAYLLLVAFMIGSIVVAVKLLKSKVASNQFKLLVLCVYVTLLAVFFLEPILQSVPWMFCTYCFYSGVLRKCVTPRLSKRAV